MVNDMFHSVTLDNLTKIVKNICEYFSTSETKMAEKQKGICFYTFRHYLVKW